MQININILSSMHKEALRNKNVYTHVAYIWLQEKRKYNSNWLKQKWNLLTHISKKSESRADFRYNLIQMSRLVSGLQLRLPLIFLVQPQGWLLCIRKTSGIKFRTSIFTPHYLQEGVFFQPFLRKPHQASCI